MSEDSDLRRRKPTEVEGKKDGTPSISEGNDNRNAPSEGVTEPAEKPETTNAPRGSFVQRTICYLFTREDSSYLAAFRVLWGIIMMIEVSYHIRMDFIKMTHRYYLNPYSFNFKYYPFEWVELMPFEWMAIFLYCLFLSAVFVTIGLQYRLSTIFFFFGISYLFLVESTNYLNHVYLVCVIAGVLIFVPCNCYLSVDAYKRPSLRRNTVPKIYLFTLRALLFVVYTYAGVVKINEDWLRAEPLRHWLGKEEDTIFGEYLTYEATAYFFSYSGIAYDLVVGALLWWKWTFYLGLLGTLVFHITNKFVFNIGIFPYVMIASTSLFFSPWWVRRLLFKLRHPFQPFKHVITPTKFSNVKVRKLTKKEKVLLVSAVLFLTFWVVFPSRNYFLGGNVVWDESGHVYSWRMKLRDKHCFTDLFMHHPATNRSYEISPPSLFLSQAQVQKFADRPWLLIQYIHFLADLYTWNDTKPEIYAYCSCSVNYRPEQPYTKHWMDLVSQDKWDQPYPWITELEPLTEEVKQEQYPWNWEWNFNWFKGINNPSNLQLAKNQRREQKDKAAERTEENRRLYVSWYNERFNQTIDPDDFEWTSLLPPRPTNRYAAYYHRLKRRRAQA